MKAHEKTFGWLVINILLLVAAFAFLVIVLAHSQNAWGQTNTVWAQMDSNTEPDLAGYRIWWSQEQGTYSQAFDIPVVNFVEKPDWNTVPTGWLEPGRWYFAATAYDTSGNESGFSEEVYVDVPDIEPSTPKETRFKLVLPNGTTIDMLITTP